MGRDAAAGAAPSGYDELEEIDREFFDSLRVRQGRFTTDRLLVGNQVCCPSNSLLPFLLSPCLFLCLSVSLPLS